MNSNFINRSLVALVFLGLTGMTYKANDVSFDRVEFSSSIALEETNGNQVALCVALVTPQELNVGEVCLSNTQDSLKVHFQVEEGWLLSETQLAVASSLDGIPKVGPGIPVIGRFGYRSSHTDSSTEQDYSIALDSLQVSPGSELVVAAHVSVINASKEEEGAWGRGKRFVKDGNPATYFLYVLDRDTE